MRDGKNTMREGERPVRDGKKCGSRIAACALLPIIILSITACGSGATRGSQAQVSSKLPAIGGVAQVGRTLQTTRGPWTGGAVRYSWAQCNATGNDCSAIPGATAKSYTLRPVDAGYTIRSVLTRSAGHGARLARSAPTSVVIGRANVYVAQNAAGPADGSNCASARPASWLGAGANWGSGQGQVGPGAMVHLCGTFTTNLGFQGSGAPGDPITLYFEPGARISLPVCPGRDIGCLDTGGHANLVINGGSNGVIESTANGTALANHVDNAVGIWALGCNGCTIQNLVIQNMYVHSSPSDTSADDDTGIYLSGSNLMIRHNVLHDDRLGLISEWGRQDANVRIYANNIYNVDHGFASTANQAGGSIGPIAFYDNTVHDYANWDTVHDSYHHDGLHCWTSAHGAAAHYNGLLVYGNRFGGATDLAGSPYGDETTAHIFIEGGASGGTPCADGSSHVYIFNNVFTASGFIYNGLVAVFSGQPRIVNNTIVGAGARVGVCYSSGGDVRGEVFASNLVSSCNTLNSSQPGIHSSLDHNLYAASASNAFQCGKRFIGLYALGAWRRCIGGDLHSRAVGSTRGLILGARIGGVGAHLH